MTTQHNEYDELRDEEQRATDDFNRNPTFTEALRRNKFLSDERGQAMVEMAVIGPVLAFMLVSIWHFFELSDAKADFLISQRNGAFAHIVGHETWVHPAVPYNDRAPYTTSYQKRRSDEVMGTGEYIGIPGGNIRNIMSIYTGGRLLTTPYVNQVEHAQNGVWAVAAVLWPQRGPFSNTNDWESLPTGASMPQNLIGTPYNSMGFMSNDYYFPRPPTWVNDNNINYMTGGQNDVFVKTVVNPWRNILLGLGRIFDDKGQAAAKDVTNADQYKRAAGLLSDPFPIMAKFPIVTDPWKADFKDNKPQLNPEKNIRWHAGGLTFWESPFGAICRLQMIATSLSEGLRSWRHMPDPGLKLIVYPLAGESKYHYKVDGRDGAASRFTFNLGEISTRRLKPLNGQNLVQMWR
jgi:Flp pilus assembly pilin Flp